MEKNKDEISRGEFNDLKDKVNKLEGVFDKINTIVVSIEKLAIEMKYMREEQTKLDNRITAIEEKPGKRYDSIVTYIITTVVGAVIGAVVSLLNSK